MFEPAAQYMDEIGGRQEWKMLHVDYQIKGNSNANINLMHINLD